MKGKYWGILVVGLGVVFSLLLVAKSFFQGQEVRKNLHEAEFYRSLEGGVVQCELCPNRCVLKEGQRGLCQVRENIGGKLYSLVYGRPVSIHLDPIEKKPLYHFLPGTKAYSLATAGCNLDCQYCQNWEIAHRRPEEVKSVSLSPQQVVEEALKQGAETIAFTYNEPVVWYEYMRDIAQEAHRRGLKTVMISSGYINPEPLKALLPYLDAVKIDFKSINSETYQRLIRGRLEPVLESIKIVYQSGTWLELVHLMVPGYTDNLEEVEKMCHWIKDNLSDEVPLHLSRFWPNYKLVNLPPTAEETIIEARERCLRVGLKYVYTGNIDDPEGSATYCPGTNQVVIKRRGYFVESNLVDEEGKVPGCPTKIAGVWR